MPPICVVAAHFIVVVFLLLFLFVSVPFYGQRLIEILCLAHRICQKYQIQLKHSRDSGGEATTTQALNTHGAT